MSSGVRPVTAPTATVRGPAVSGARATKETPSSGEPPTKATRWSGARQRKTPWCGERAVQRPRLRTGDLEWQIACPWAAANSTHLRIPLAWHGLPRLAQVYVAVVTIAGTASFILSLPHSYPDPLLLGRPAPACVCDLRVEGDAAALAVQRFNALGLVRRRSDGAAASRPGSGGDCRRRRRVDAVHVQGQADVSALPHWVQHGGRSDHDGRTGLVLRRRLAANRDRPISRRSPSRSSARSRPTSSSTPA